MTLLRSDQNWAEAQYELGRCLEAGAGIDKDEKRAWENYIKAANQNLPQGLCMVGPLIASPPCVL